MNKSELIEAIRDQLGENATKASAEAALTAVVESIKQGVTEDGGVQIFGFGSFKVSERAAREGRNPKTGKKMKIAASKSVRFSPASAFKGAL